jgi:hypothetical protein
MHYFIQFIRYNIWKGNKKLHPFKTPTPEEYRWETHPHTRPHYYTGAIRTTRFFIQKTKNENSYETKTYVNKKRNNIKLW